MNETMRTAIYVGAAVFALVAARFAGPTIPKPPTAFSQVGTEFFPDFTDAKAAKSLQVVNYNQDTATIRIFGVEQGPDGVWRVPSRHGYPVDGKDRLGKTATSVIGIKRDQLAGQRKNQHAEFGVIDPLGESVSDFKGVGNRLTLKDGKDGKVLADLIIGKEVKGRNGFFYVRNPNEDQTYIAKVSIDVSTKFSDWIEPDLLKLDGSKLRTVIIDKHTIEFAPGGGGGHSTAEELNKLTRTSSTDKWKLEGLDEATEEVNEDEVRKMVQALDDLKIVGVRPKSDRLKTQLQNDKAIVPDLRTARDMEQMGYYFAESKQRRALQLVSQEGDLYATTDQGVLYELHFGSVFSGTEEEVEAGFMKKSDDDASDENKSAEKKDEKKESEDKPNSKKLKSRYLFVQALFEADAVGPKPVAPEKPQAPPEEADEKAAEKETPADAATTENGSNKVDPKKAHEAALAKYEADVKKYEADVKAHEDKITAGKKLVKDLNRRFAEWYYVISGDSFEELRQGRKTLVKEKPAQKPEATKPDATPKTDE